MEQTKSKSNAWLNEYARSVTSQGGEDGIIEQVLKTIGATDKWCVEFGSWDGVKLSNTYNLIANEGYHGVLIECHEKRFGDLLNTYKDNDRVIPLNRLVGFDSDNCLDKILAETPIPKNFDLLSIDVDGNDYHIWDAVRQCRPKVVVIEFNPSIPPEVEFVQPRDMNVTQGSSILSINKLAKSKGYELVAVSCNAIYVDAAYFDLFGIHDNSLHELWMDRSSITHIFCGYDGTVFLRGCRVMPWQQIRYDESKMQHLPVWARKRFGDQNFLRRRLGKWYRRFRSRRSQKLAD